MWTIEVKADKCAVCGGEIECSERVLTPDGPAHFCHFEICHLYKSCFPEKENENVQTVR